MEHKLDQTFQALWRFYIEPRMVSRSEKSQFKPSKLLEFIDLYSIFMSILKSL